MNKYFLGFITLLVLYIGLIVLICNIKIHGYVYIPVSAVIGMALHRCYDKMKLH